mgnify:FL=1
MCGIVGILGHQDVASALVDALKRLEYRGYDSAGIATLDHGKLDRRRAEGKLRNLEHKLTELPLHGATGIGHTRWATHGRPVERNAHPHATHKVAVVHNGIIENFRELREELEAQGVVFESDTDTEVVAQLLTRVLETQNDPVKAVEVVLPRLRGAFALGILFAGADDLLIGARQGAPLAIGYGAGEMYLGSDALALAPFTSEITYLDDGDWVVLSRKGAEIFDASNRIVKRAKVQSAAGAYSVDKGNHRHFMMKEIHEQPEVVGRTLAHYLDMGQGEVSLPEGCAVDFSKVDRLTIAACGTAFYSGLVAKYWFERFARLNVDIDIASEFRYREAPLNDKGLSLFISQSGETADTLAALRYAKSAGQKVLAVVNVPTSTIARESDYQAPTLAGPEIGVASTKAFTCQMTVLACLALAAGRQRGVLSKAQEKDLIEQLIAVPGLMAQALKQAGAVKKLANDLSKVKDVLFLGRGTSYPMALEGALKLKELSYIHAEGYAAGELKHGPIALIDEDMPVIVIAPRDGIYEKTISNMHEVAARGGRITLISDLQGVQEADIEGAAYIPMQPMPPDFSAIVYAVPVQFLSYYAAVALGTDVDQPRNLAKSVTVE